MNIRTKEFIVAIQDHKAVFGETNVTAFHTGMKGIEPDFYSKDTLTKKLDEAEFCFFVNKLGKVYEIYRYKNPRLDKSINSALS